MLPKQQKVTMHSEVSKHPLKLLVIHLLLQQPRKLQPLPPLQYLQLVLPRLLKWNTILLRI